jgi:glycosyltransferase involved in cell wall biosynthesis
LCHARNLGLKIASGEFIAYLDDDNELLPSFIDWLKLELKRENYFKLLIPQQLRRRNVVSNGEIVKLGKKFISPSTNSTLNDLIIHKELFDSNGFIHSSVLVQWESNIWGVKIMETNGGKRAIHWRV